MKMKQEFMVLLVCLCLACILIAGCTTPTTTPAVTPTATPISTQAVTPAATLPNTTVVTPIVTDMPDLRGNWTGTSGGYVDTSGYQVFNEEIRLNVVEQTDRLFKGQILFPQNGTVTTKKFAGTLGTDGKTIKEVEYPGGFSDGVVISSDEIESDLQGPG